MMSAERKLTIGAAWALMVLGGWSIAQRAAEAEEIVTPQRLCVESKVNNSPLTRLPYIGRLFVNELKEPSECRKLSCEAKCAEKCEIVERIGIDFENASEACAHDRVKLACEKLEVLACPACPTVAHVAEAAKVACGACPANACHAALSACSQQAQCVAHTVTVEETCDEKPCNKTACVVTAHIADLVAENTALELALQAKEEALQAQNKMFERITKLMSENVELQVQLHYQEQLHAAREESSQQIQKLADENRRLQSVVELAAMRHEVERAKQELAQENLRLKARVTELEVAANAAQSEVRVAKKRSDEKSEK